MTEKCNTFPLHMKQYCRKSFLSMLVICCLCLQLSRLGGVGGKTTMDTTRRVMSALMTTETARALNFEGRRGPKTGLQKLPVILEVIRGEH